MQRRNNHHNGKTILLAAVIVTVQNHKNCIISGKTHGLFTVGRAYSDFPNRQKSDLIRVRPEWLNIRNTCHSVNLFRTSCADNLNNFLFSKKLSLLQQKHFQVFKYMIICLEEICDSSHVGVARYRSLLRPVCNLLQNTFKTLIKQFQSHYCLWELTFKCFNLKITSLGLVLNLNTLNIIIFNREFRLLDQPIGVYVFKKKPKICFRKHYFL